MGRQLVAQAFLLYANALGTKPTAMVCLVFMANTAKDGEAEPTFWMGNESLAELALGRPKKTPADLRAVRRALSDLRSVGAITTVGRPAPGRRMATYRLHMDEPASMERRTVNVLRERPPRDLTQDGERPITQDGERPMHVGRSPSYKAQEVDIGLGKTPGQTAAPAPRAQRAANGVPTAARETFARNGLRVGLHTINGGRSDADTDDQARQPPLLGLVPNDPEPVVPQQLSEAQ